jgi:hypothetical protein
LFNRFSLQSTLKGIIEILSKWGLLIIAIWGIMERLVYNIVMGCPVLALKLNRQIKRPGGNLSDIVAIRNKNYDII